MEEEDIEGIKTLHEKETPDEKIKDELIGYNNSVRIIHV